MVQIRPALMAAILVFSSIVSHYDTQAFPKEDELVDEKRDRCRAKCGGEQAEAEAFKNGKGICLDPNLAGGESWGPIPTMIVSPCELDCMDEKGLVPKDQQPCFCNACGEARPDYTFKSGFCSGPGVGQIKDQSECGEKFCKGEGNVKFYGRAYCESG